MNQPSAEELDDAFRKQRDEPNGIRGLYYYILDRYHLIDKTEPIPGAVSAQSLEESGWAVGADREFLIELTETFDIYPKGTVARLTREVERWLRLETENSRLNSVIHDAHAEVERLKGEVEELKKAEVKNADLAIAYSRDYQRLQAEIDRLKGQQKPEVVGCGRLFRRDNLSHQQVCTKAYPCPDCQAKANQPGKIESVFTVPPSTAASDTIKVVLPEVPDIDLKKKRSFEELVLHLADITKELIKHQKAVKAHLEGEE